MRLVETTRSNIISYAIHNMVETISNSSPPDLTDQKAIAVASEAIPQSSRGLRPPQTPFLLLQTPFQHTRILKAPYEILDARAALSDSARRDSDWCWRG